MFARIRSPPTALRCSPPAPRLVSHSYIPKRPFFPHSRGNTRLLSTASPPKSYAAAAGSLPSPSKASSFWTKTAIGTTIALATSATVLNQLSKAPMMEGLPSSSIPLPSRSISQDLRDEDNRIGVEKKSTAELLRSMLVYKLCTFQLLVDLAPRLISLAETLHLTPPVYWFVRHTFFSQFCGGETAEDCVGTMNALKNAGIGSILDLSVEADLDEEELAKYSPEQLREQFNKSADSVAAQISTCIETASNLSKSFAAIKVTAMGSPLLLQRVSSILVSLEKTFKSSAALKDRNGRVTMEEFRQLTQLLPKAIRDDKYAEQLFKEADKDGDGLIDWVDFASTVSMNRSETQALFVVSDSERQQETQNNTIAGLSKEEMEDYQKVLRRMERLCDQAAKTHTRLMIDAEQTYFQPAIDSVALHLQEHYNNTPHADGPLIFNTYQMYLKDALGRLQQDYKRAERNGYVLAAKLVRGAYMVSERKRAVELGLDDPICTDIEATHKSYNAGVDFMLEKMTEARERASTEKGLTVDQSPVVLFVASHNKDSVIRTCERMQELSLSPQAELVMFGQLMGMCDQISYTLGQHGYGIYKYVPYGPIHHVIPYLIRRAQENNSVLGGVGVERRLLWEEVKSRFGFGSPKPTIQAVPVPAPTVTGISSTTAV
ncbi:hypothetical protein BGW41_008113 [Actinomortierella wolfii]|nr:hypothetical protein BGW41_008113 [Actinomortierella wolfii]